ncbi:MAG: recombinase zinc beta ribbon domain-containing protein, partial [Clostridia bacterium]|nr:recombinase zinc beta ribbon domain-containing protein [Clostridia bacterium]
TYLLSGLSVCAVCRRRLVGSVRHDWGRAHRYYTCRRRGPGAGGCRPPRYVPAGPLEEAVWRAVSQALMDLLRDVPTEARPAGPGRSTAEPAGGAAGSTAGVATDRVCPDRRRLLRRTILAALEAGLLSPEEALAELAHVAPEEGGAGAGASTAAGGPAAVPSAVPSAAADPLDEGETVRTDTAATHVGTAAVAFFGEADTGLRRRVLALVVRSVVVGEEVVVEAVLPSPAAGDARTPSLRTRC